MTKSKVTFDDLFLNLIAQTSIEKISQPALTCLKLTIETLEQVKLRTYFTLCSSVSIVNFEHVIAGWDYISYFPISFQ